MQRNRDRFDFTDASDELIKGRALAATTECKAAAAAAAAGTGTGTVKNTGGEVRWDGGPASFWMVTPGDNR